MLNELLQKTTEKLGLPFNNFAFTLHSLISFSFTTQSKSNLSKCQCHIIHMLHSHRLVQTLTRRRSQVSRPRPQKVSSRRLETKTTSLVDLQQSVYRGSHSGPTVIKRRTSDREVAGSTPA